jgi:ADP-ribose pyrophosphatase YjhB (NUDIX family)
MVAPVLWPCGHGGDDAMHPCAIHCPTPVRTPAFALSTMLQPRRIKHCRACGTEVHYRIPSDDNRERAVCGECGIVHYENPLNVVGTLPVWQDRVLLCKRNIEPRYGMWTLPAGFMEMGESVEAGALRETDEEAGARVELEGLYTMLNVIRIGQVHFFYRARLLDTTFNPGPETIEARLFTESEVPWEQLAFRTVRETLHRYFDDRRRGQFGMHFADIV